MLPRGNGSRPTIGLDSSQALTSEDDVKHFVFSSDVRRVAPQIENLTIAEVRQAIAKNREAEEDLLRLQVSTRRLLGLRLLT